MSERQVDINNEVLYFIATGKNTKRTDIDHTFDNYTGEEIDTALTGLACTGYIDCQDGVISATPKSQFRVEEYKKSLPRTVRKT